MVTYSGIGMGKITNGYDFNFFQKLDITASDFNNNADMFVPFVTQGVLMLNTGSGTIEFSFNGNTVHGELNSANASAGMAFDNRVVGKIWFRVQSGSSGPITVSVNAWAGR